MLGAILGLLSLEGVERPFRAPAVLASPVFFVGGARREILYAIVGEIKSIVKSSTIFRKRKR